MNMTSLAMLMALVGVDLGWQPRAGGGLEYIVQIEPQALSQLPAGHDLVVDLPPDLTDVRSFRLTVGTAPLPRSTKRVATSAGKAANAQTQYTAPVTAQAQPRAAISRTPQPIHGDGSVPVPPVVPIPRGSFAPNVSDPAATSAAPRTAPPSNFNNTTSAAAAEQELPLKLPPPPGMIGPRAPANSAIAPQTATPNSQEWHTAPSAGVADQQPATSFQPDERTAAPATAEQQRLPSGRNFPRGASSPIPPRRDAQPPTGQVAESNLPPDNREYRLAVVEARLPPMVEDGPALTATAKAQPSGANTAAAKTETADEPVIKTESKPWGWLMLTLLALFLSVGFNFFLGWTTLGFRQRYESLLSEIDSAHVRAA